MPPFVVPSLYFHGTRAQLQAGELIEPGYRSNFGSGRRANHVYLSATLDAAVWGAELAVGEGTARIYIVEPTGQIEDDPNLADKKFRGNPTKSYRSKAPLRVVGELWEWQGHAPDVLKAMKDNVLGLQISAGSRRRLTRPPSGRAPCTPNGSYAPSECGHAPQRNGGPLGGHVFVLVPAQGQLVRPSCEIERLRSVDGEVMRARARAIGRVRSWACAPETVPVVKQRKRAGGGDEHLCGAPPSR